MFHCQLLSRRINCRYQQQELIADINSTNAGFQAESIFALPTVNETQSVLKIIMESKQDAGHALVNAI